MSENSPPQSPEDEDNSLAEILHAERRKVLDSAGRFHELAHRNNAVATGVADEMYIVTDDHDIPLVSEKIKIVPFNSRTAPFSEAYLYLPFDSEFREEDEHVMIPNILFLRMYKGTKAAQQVIVSESTVWVFEGKQSMVIDTSVLNERSRDLDVPALFPGGSDLLPESEYALLQDIQTMLSDKTRYRLGGQRERREPKIS